VRCVFMGGKAQVATGFRDVLGEEVGKIKKVMSHVVGTYERGRTGQFTPGKMVEPAARTPQLEQIGDSGSGGERSHQPKKNRTQESGR